MKIKIISYLLSTVAGLINGLILYLFGETISHHTGNLTKIGIYFQEKPGIFKISLLIVLVFLLGGISNSFILKDDFKKNKALFKRSFLIIGIIFFILSYFPLNITIILITTFFMGFQGSFPMTFEGIPVRTVHMTGYLSDIGRFTGQFLRGQKENQKKLVFISISVLFFILGSVLAFLLIKNPKRVYIIAGFLYIICGIILGKSN